jgi:hypothetical protein
VDERGRVPDADGRGLQPAALLQHCRQGEDPRGDEYQSGGHALARESGEAASEQGRGERADEHRADRPGMEQEPTTRTVEDGFGPFSRDDQQHDGDCERKEPQDRVDGPFDKLLGAARVFLRDDLQCEGDEDAWIGKQGAGPQDRDPG